jgi:hypothetical protein
MPVTNLRAFSDLVASHDLPHPYTPRRPVALGPDNYSAAQALAYTEQWFFELDGTTVTIGRQDGLGTPATQVSALYDSAFTTTHLSGAFDSVSRELLAWDLGENVAGTKQARVGFYVGGVATFLTFDGFNPVCVNTWPIDGDAATPADAEVGVFYLRPGFPYLFYRSAGDAFATEFVALRSPSAPFALHSVAINGAFLEVRGLDVGHRKTAWRSEYVPPIPPQIAVATLELVAGEFVSMIVIESVGPDQGFGSLELVPGTFESTVITESVGPDQASDPLNSSPGHSSRP